ncbi:hypothetical protein F0562_000252 [Nyssa sinensis]|uniref:Glycine-rich protein n=1 Tax=Nyssa sinensis TaxID=561372 RepID=A0A5J5C4F6_9ASTE|nr:hypothetical protein F0562_000252 [Nyssa sinensis]
MAAKLYVMFLLALVLVHVTARNVPSTTAPSESTAVNHEERNVEKVAGGATAPSGAGLDDEKNFIVYGGVGGFAGVGGYAGVLPLGGVGGLGGASGLGGAGGLGGLGGLGGAGGGVGGAGASRRRESLHDDVI